VPSTNPRLSPWTLPARFVRVSDIARSPAAARCVRLWEEHACRRVKIRLRVSPSIAIPVPTPTTLNGCLKTSWVPTHCGSGRGIHRFSCAAGETLSWTVIVQANSFSTFSKGRIAYDTFAFTDCSDEETDCPSDADQGVLKVKR
jgi:hypothetical protein